MDINDSNIDKVLTFIGMPLKGRGYHYLVDLLLERSFCEGEDKPAYCKMINDVAYINDVDPQTVRRGVELYISKSVYTAPRRLGQDKYVFLLMLNALPIASLVEGLYTLMKNTKEEDYDE